MLPVSRSRIIRKGYSLVGGVPKRCSLGFTNLHAFFVCVVTRPNGGLLFVKRRFTRFVR